MTEISKFPNLKESILFTPNTDGTFTRPFDIFPIVPPSIDDPSSPSLSKDVSINSDKSTWVRLFIPRLFIESPLPSSSKKKRPILVYIHGGGFICLSAGHPVFHDFCAYAASQLNALVVSVEYRLAPEHRLPAAYDDVLDALTWVKEGKDEWIEEYGDISSCVMMGDSAGANIVYHTGLTVAARMNEFKPLMLKGLVLIQPFFSGLDRTGSELRSENDKVLKLHINDLCWEISLPIGSDRGHKYCDPVKDGGSELLDRVWELGWRVWVLSCDGDPLCDRSVELVKLMEKKGLSVKFKLREGGEHGMFVGNPSKCKADELLDFVKDFFT